MGIPGILKEIGKGERVALAKLAVEFLEKEPRRPLRIAIDAAIWTFQTQIGGHGGKNPALRTFFYRLLRILALPIHPVFVYDGRNKPLSKRGRTVQQWASPSYNSTESMELLRHFRFPYHVAPGEAEAECARLQQKGVVDMVMSEDGDAIMFGSGVTLRDWSKEGTGKGSKGPTHVYKLESKAMKELSGLDADGMILVALLRGGDYNPGGVEGFGVGLACEIARAGFGQDLLELFRNGGSDQEFSDWRERLQFELESNESGFFKCRHRTVKIPDNFPDRTLLGYYANPAVSNEKDLEELKKKWTEIWDSDIDIARLRDYVGKTFDWQYRSGASKFVRVMAPPLLAYTLRRGLEEQHVSTMEQITGRRQDFGTGGIPELRITAVPVEVVGLDLEAEEEGEERDEGPANSQQDLELEVGDDGDGQPTHIQKSTGVRKGTAWLPTNPDKMWIPETIVKLGAPAVVEEWEQGQRDKTATRKVRAANTTKVVKSTSTKSIQQFFPVSKAVGKDKDTISVGSTKAGSADAASAHPDPARGGMAKPAVEEEEEEEEEEGEKKKVAAAPKQSRSSRSIASFFVAAKAKAEAEAEAQASASASASSSKPSQKISPGPSPSEPGARTTNLGKATHAHITVLPRESLPGSWKVADLEAEEVPGRGRTKRVSYVDLTGD